MDVRKVDRPNCDGRRHNMHTTMDTLCTARTLLASMCLKYDVHIPISTLATEAIMDTNTTCTLDLEYVKLSIVPGDRWQREMSSSPHRFIGIKQMKSSNSAPVPLTPHLGIDQMSFCG